MNDLQAGGGVKPGRIIGATDATGEKVIDTGWKYKKMQPRTENLYASVYSALGIDWSKRIANTPSGRAFEYLESSSGPNAIAPGEIALLFEDKWDA